MSTPKIQMPAPTPAQSERLNALQSREASLTTERAASNTWENRWHRAYEWALVLTAVLGGFSILFQVFERKDILSGKRAEEAIAEVERQRHEIERQISDFAIAQAQSIGSEATAAAKVADQKAQEAQQKTEQLKLDSEELRKANLETEANLTRANAEIAAVNAKRLELERSLAPRTFDANGKIVNLDKLRESSRESISCCAFYQMQNQSEQPLC
jgi:hypothetical protein